MQRIISLTRFLSANATSCRDPTSEIWHEVMIDGIRRSIYEVLADAELGGALSDEGALFDARALMAPVAPR